MKKYIKPEYLIVDDLVGTVIMCGISASSKGHGHHHGWHHGHHVKGEIIAPEGENKDTGDFDFEW